MQITLPKGLDLSKEISTYNSRWDDKYKWVIHSILFSYFTNQTDWDRYVNLNFSILKKFIGERYLKKVLTSLIDSDIIAISKSYSAGEYSRSYKLTDRFKDCKFQSYKLNKSEQYKRKVDAIVTDSLKKTLQGNKVLQSEFRALTYNRIALKPALKYIKANYKEGTRQYISRIHAIRQYNAMKDANFNDWSYSINFVFKYIGGRLYTPASMLPRDLEQFTYFDNYEDEDVAVLDMPTSQPKFYDRMINGKPSGIDTPYQKLLFNSDKDLYYTLMTLINYNDKSNHTPEERQEFKQYFYGNLFFNKYTPKDKRTILEQAFAINYPNDAKKLLSLKYRIGNSALAKRVHKLEGKLFHVKIVSFMEQNYKHIPYSIKHDSIKIPIRFVDELKPQFEEIVSSYFGRQLELNLETK